MPFFSSSALPYGPCAWYCWGMRILLVDDDVELCSLLEELLERENFEVRTEHNGARGLELALSGQFDLIVLDVMLPGLEGFEVLRQLRRSSMIPVLMLTARGEDVDRIVGLELVARIGAIARGMDAKPAGDSRRLEINGVILDPGSREVFKDGEKVEMTTLEFDILEMLMRAAGRVLSRDALMEHLYNRKASPFDRSIDMHISHLRKKLETDRTIFKSIRGVGYQFCRSSDEVND